MSTLSSPITLPVLLLLLLLLPITSLCHQAHHHHAHTGFVQHCQSSSSSARNGHDDSDEDAFCVSTTSFKNPSTGMSDLLVSLQVRRRRQRREDLARGWTAVGPGDAMHGAMMMVVYGDPDTGAPHRRQRPIVSIRTTQRHAPPRLISLEEAAGADFDLRHAVWTTTADVGSGGDDGGKGGSGAVATALVNLVVSNCTMWAGTAVDVGATSQPWIWARNADQEFDVYSFDAPLAVHGPRTEMKTTTATTKNRNPHAQGAAAADYGRFYLDMSLAASTWALPAFPPILPLRGNIGAAVDEEAARAKTVSRQRAWRLHGVLMGAAFLVLSPAGVAALRRRRSPSAAPTSSSSSSSSSLFFFSGHRRGCGSFAGYRAHWILQLLAGASFSLGALTALLLEGGVDFGGHAGLHQLLGLALGALGAGQALLGWRRHVLSSVQKNHRVRRRGDAESDDNNVNVNIDNSSSNNNNSNEWKKKKDITTKVRLFSLAHVWIGRAVLLPLGALNLLYGMILHAAGTAWIVVAGALIVAEAIGLGMYLKRAAERRKAVEVATFEGTMRDEAGTGGERGEGEGEGERLNAYKEQEAAFVLDGGDSEDED